MSLRHYMSDKYQIKNLKRFIMKNIEHYRSFDHGLAYVTGVSDLNPWALRYMLRPHNHTTDFDKYCTETIDMFKKLMHTNSALITVPGPGRVVMDVAMNSFLEPGDKLLLSRIKLQTPVWRCSGSQKGSSSFFACS